MRKAGVSASNASVSFHALPWRIWLMLALSVFAIVATWWFHPRSKAADSGPAVTGQLNVSIAISFALLLVSDPALASRRWGAPWLASGAIILALKR
jgi:hypothetical protein